MRSARPVVLAVLIAGVAAGQGLEPRERVEDYPAHGRAGKIEVGAEFHFRGVPASRAGKARTRPT